jgi:hypothetical protein
MVKSSEVSELVEEALDEVAVAIKAGTLRSV